MAVNTRNVRIYENPESKIRFLETLLHGKDWSANIIISDKTLPAGTNKDTYAKQLQQQFNAWGYSSELSTDSQNHLTLHIHHVGDETSFYSTIEKMGLTKGVSFTLTHLNMPLSQALNSAYGYAEYIIKEPARLFSGIFLLGDIMLLASGAKAKVNQGKFLERIKNDIAALKDPANALQSSAGIFALLQSLIFIKFANSGSELAYKEITSQYHAGIKSGIDPINVSQWAANNDQKPSVVHSLLKRYPIEAGSIAQILGQIAFAGSSMLQIKKLGWANAKGYKTNILSAALSIASWSMFVKNPKHHDEKTPWDKNPLTRGWQEFEEHPERFASIVTAAASSIGLYGAIKTGNKFQQYAESLWLLGDAVLFFTQKNHYGNVAARKEDPLIQAATKFMTELPLALGPMAHERFIQDLSHVLAEKATRQSQNKTFNHIPSPTYLKDIETLQDAIEKGVKDNLAKISSHYDKLIRQTAQLVERFPQKERTHIIETLSSAMAESTGIHASKEEFTVSLNRHVSLTINVGTSPPLTIADILPNIRHVTEASGPTAAPFVGLAIYNALAPLIPESKSETLSQDKHPHLLLKNNARQPASFVDRITANPTVDLTQHVM